MGLKEILETNRERRLVRLEERDRQKREDRKNGIKLPAKIVRAIKRMSIPKRIGICALIVVIIVSGLGGAYLFGRKKTLDFTKNGMNRPDMTNMGDVVTATGTTTVGMVDETFDVDSLDTSLEIEEVYLNNGDEVEKGTAILKISDESLEAARKELEQEAKSAEYAYRLGLVDYEESLISAKGTYDQASVNSAYADIDYQNEVQEKAEKVAELKSQVEDQQALVDEYTASNENDYYYTYYDIENLKDELYKNFTLLMQLYEEWDIEELSEGFGKNDKLTLYEDFTKEVDEEQEEYDTALENYEKAKRKASTNIAKETATLESLKAQLAQAQVEYDEAVAAANSTKTETVAQSGIAEDTYNTAVEKAEEDLATLKDAMDDADDNLTAFNESISDGYMYTSTAGTIMMVAASKGGTLTADGLVIAYTDESKISVSASVSQDDIASLTVGQSATVMFEDYDNYEGVITAINPNTSSSSRSSVTYTVTVELQGDVSELSQNLTATVMFKDAKEEKQGGNN